MGPKVTVQSPGQNRISINNPGVNRTIRVVPGGSGGSGGSGATTLVSLTDVDASSSDDGDVLVYNIATGKYEIKIIPLIDGGTY